MAAVTMNTILRTNGQYEGSQVTQWPVCYFSAIFCQPSMLNILNDNCLFIYLFYFIIYKYDNCNKQQHTMALELNRLSQYRH